MQAESGFQFGEGVSLTYSFTVPRGSARTVLHLGCGNQISAKRNLFLKRDLLSVISDVPLML
jgi:hypothetical protein